MADLYAGLGTGSPALDGPADAAVAALFLARYPEMVRLADLGSSEQVALLKEDHREVLAALADCRREDVRRSS